MPLLTAVVRGLSLEAVLPRVLHSESVSIVCFDESNDLDRIGSNCEPRDDG